ncbi:transcript variant X1, partial [Nothobranchius furzeri]
LAHGGTIKSRHLVPVSTSSTSWTESNFLTGLQIMARLIHLSLMLAAIQLPEATAQFSAAINGTNVTYGNCVEMWTYTCTDNSVWQLKCDMIKLQMTLTLDCISGPSTRDLWMSITSLFGTPWVKHLCSSCNINNPSSVCKGFSSSVMIPVSSIPDVINIRYGNECGLTQIGTSLMFKGEPKSWIEALKACHMLTSSLVELTNQTVQDKVRSLLQDKSSLENGVWVGLERSIFGTDPDWMWASGSRSVNLKWNNSFPVDRWNNHCGKIIWGQGSGLIQLLDANCHDELPYICQRPV